MAATSMSSIQSVVVTVLCLYRADQPPDTAKCHHVYYHVFTLAALYSVCANDYCPVCVVDVLVWIEAFSKGNRPPFYLRISSLELILQQKELK